MSRRVFRYFISLENQEKWLNRMAAEGWRLVKVDAFSYTFEPCQPSAYKYCLEFVGGKTKRELDAYMEYLRERQMTFFSKAINLGKFSYGSLRWRPYGRKWGTFATAPGTINSEILILERENDGGNSPI